MQLGRRGLAAGASNHKEIYHGLEVLPDFIPNLASERKSKISLKADQKTSNIQDIPPRERPYVGSGLLLELQLQDHLMLMSRSKAYLRRVKKKIDGSTSLKLILLE